MGNETSSPYASARRSQFFAQLEQDREQAKETREMVKAIHTALIGDPALGNPGIVKRMSDVETAVATKAAASEVKTISEKVEAHDRKFWLVGVLPTLLAAGLAIKTFFSGK